MLSGWADALFILILIYFLYFCLIITYHKEDIMYFKRRNKKQRYYVCCSSVKRAIISTSMKYIADYVGVSTKTIARHFVDGDMFIYKGFIVSKNVSIHTIERGFGIVTT